jgi:ATP-dependent DNA helicase DinG
VSSEDTGGDGDFSPRAEAGSVLGPDGPFALLQPGFQPRAGQQAMADAVADAIDSRQHLVIEAGTGIGKTFGYLVPALLSGRKLVVSTATRTLQDQLYRDDLPRVRRALGLHPDCALLKGRANYLCRYRLRMAAGQPGLWPAEATQIARLDAWAMASEEGDIVEVGDIPEDAPVWSQVTSTADNCLGQGCPDFETCFVVKARRRAAAADVVVVNHHLLFADMALREEGFGELLPTARLVVVDEAHQLPELAAQAFGQAVSSRRLRDLVRDGLAGFETEAPDTPDLRDALRLLEVKVQNVAATLGRYPGRREFETLAEEPGVMPVLDALRAALDAVSLHLAEASERGPALESCTRRAQEIRERLGDFAAREEADWVRWTEISARGFVLHATPLSVAEQFSERLATSPATWIFCSATLALDGDFTHFKREMGLEGALAASWDSPFDYPRQALCLLPGLASLPNEERYLTEVARLAIEVIGLSRGRAFLLCTSHRALEHYAQPLREALPYPVLVQGEAPRGLLLERFRALGNAVLIGTSTFWEGVDVRGEALSCVIIDKLPFAPPDDPVLRARTRRLAAEGRDVFREHQLPVAALALKQGAGRLIRDTGDRGVLVLCDPRLTQRSYGKTFLRALPAMTRTRTLADVRGFFSG